MPADLHCHSTFSDGSVDIPDLIDFARRFGIDCIAITDHDTMAGVAEAVECGAKNGVRIIPAAECSCTDKVRGRGVHMLCYNPVDVQALNAELAKTLEIRRIQKLEIIKKLSQYYPIKVDDVLKYQGNSASIYESHIVHVLADFGLTNVIIGGEMSKRLKRGGDCFVDIEYNDVRETARLIKEVGGTAVIAHPEQYNSLELTAELAEKKLIDGVEVFHPRNSENTREALLEIAKKYQLIVTGGSDFHGQFTSNPRPIGYCSVADEIADKLLNNK